MAAVKSRGNQSTEVKILTLFRQEKIIGWRRHYRVIGRPDFCWPKQKLALFLDGCFWHGCPRCYSTPKSNVRFWKTKMTTNRKRDKEVARALRKKGWTVLRLWECRLANRRFVSRIRDTLTADE